MTDMFFFYSVCSQIYGKIFYVTLFHTVDVIIITQYKNHQNQSDQVHVRFDFCQEFEKTWMACSNVH